MPKIVLKYNQVEDLIKLIEAFGIKVREPNCQDGSESNIEPHEVLLELRNTFRNFANYESFTKEVKEKFDFGARFIDKMIDASDLSEEDFVNELIAWAILEGEKSEKETYTI